MVTAYSKGAKRRAKQARQDMPGLAETPRRGKDKCFVDRTRQQPNDPDPQRTVLEARARQAGLTPDKLLEAKPGEKPKRMGLTRAQAHDMKRARLSEQAGMALDIMCNPDDATRLWGHYVAFTASEARYHRSIGKSLYAKTAKIEMMQEPFETRPDDQVDLRSEEERDRDAVTSWMRWQGMIGRLDASDRTPIYDAYRREVMLVEAGKVTPAGQRFVRAMVRLDRLL